MSQREASALRRLVRERFKAIRAQLPHAAREELNRRVEIIDSEFDAVVWGAQERGQRLADEYRDLHDRITAHQNRCQDDGLTAASVVGYASRLPGPDIVGAALSTWRSKSADSAVRAARREVEDALRRAEASAKVRESALIESLILRDITSDEAVAFLGEVPSAGGMLSGTTGSVVAGLLDSITGDES